MYYIICILFGIIVGWAISNKNDKYWIGRQDGWFACEDMIMKRAKEKGYNTKKLWEDLVQ